MSNELTTDDLLKFIGKLYVEKEVLVIKNNQLAKKYNDLEKEKVSQENEGD